MRSKRSIVICIVILLISLIIIGNCKREKGLSGGEQAAKAAQQIETPKLAPPLLQPVTGAPESKTTPEKKEGQVTAGETPPVAIEAKQTGTITLLTPPSQQPAAGIPPAPPPIATQPTPSAPTASLPAAIEPIQPTAPTVPSIPALGGVEKTGPAPVEAQPKTIPSEPPAASAEAIAFAPELVKTSTNINVVLDASGSQAAPFGAMGISKLDLQKSSLAGVVPQMKLPEFPRNIGVRVFGSQKPVEQHDCADTVKLYPVSAPDLDAIQKALSPVIAQGESPIAAALEAASKDFPPSKNVDQIIVLITDGSDTCGVDPCQTAKMIHIANPKTIIHVIGYDLTKDDEQKVTCIATNSEGRYFLARNENELRKSLDEAVNSTIPYNLRLSTEAGATPIPTTITILKGGTNQAIKTEQSFGIKLLRLPPGTYDILVEYNQSPELKKPSKIIKGVEILEKIKVEQDINFELGSVTLSSIDTNGRMSAARYQVLKSGTTDKVAEIDGQPEATTFYLSPGIYDIAAEQKDTLPEKISLVESGVEVKTGEAVERTFRFQKGSLALRGVTTQNISIPFIFQIFKADRADQIVASGAMEKDGGAISLAPGSYDLLLIGQDPSLSANPRTKVGGAVINATQTTEVTVTFEMGLLKLSAADGQGNPVQAEFVIRTTAPGEEMGHYQMADAKTPVSISIPPGTYDIIASSATQVIEPKPTVIISNVEVKATTPVDKVAKFVFGTVRVRGRNAKEQPVETKFAVYRAGTDEEIAEAAASADWLTFEIAPGSYDIKGENMSAESELKPSLWIKDVVVEDGKQVSHEAIFTAGKLKIIGRGPNNKIISCHFKVYQYGADRELINGDTGDDWQVFDIQPGNYYLEAAYTDPEASVVLKKWINVKVGENEVLELILRF